MEDFFLNIYRRFKGLSIKYKALFLFLKIVISVSFVIYVLSRTNFEGLSRAFSGINVGFLFLTVFITFLATIFYNLRYARILSLFDMHIPFWGLYVINRFSNLINFFLPGGVGQEIGRLSYIDGKKKVIASSLVDRFLGLLSLLILLLASVFFTSVGSTLYILLIILAFLAAAAGYWYVRTRFHLKMGLSLVWSLVYSFLLVVMAFFQFKAVGIEIDFLHLLFWVPLINLLLTLPISIQGYGLLEFFWFIVLSLLAEQVLAYTILGYLINFVLSIPGFVILLRGKKPPVPISSGTDSN